MKIEKVKEALRARNLRVRKACLWNIIGSISSGILADDGLLALAMDALNEQGLEVIFEW